MAGYVTIDAVNRAEVSLGDLIKLNGLMDAQQAAEAEAMRKGGKR